jgi:predicted CopG family antitoxin
MPKRIQFLLSDEEYEYLKEIKETQNKPFSVVIRQALEKTWFM